MWLPTAPVLLRAISSSMLLIVLNVSIILTGNSNIANAQAITIGPTLDAVVGNRLIGYAGDGGPAASAELNGPEYIAFDSAGNIYISDGGNNVIRKVNTAGVITTVAGDGTQGFSGDGGPATSADLNEPDGIAVDSAGNLYIADFHNARVRKVAAATGHHHDRGGYGNSRL